MFLQTTQGGPVMSMEKTKLIFELSRNSETELLVM